MSLVKLYFAADLRLFPEYNNYSDIKIYKKGPDRVSYPFSEFLQCLWLAWEGDHHDHHWVSANPPFTNPAYGPVPYEVFVQYKRMDMRILRKRRKYVVSGFDLCGLHCM